MIIEIARSRIDALRALACAACLAVSAVALVQTPPPQDKAAAIKQALASNQAALRQYSWVETTQTSLKGEVKKQEQKQCYDGADGKVQKTLIPGNAPPPKQEKSGGGRSLRSTSPVVNVHTRSVEEESWT